MVSLAVLPYWEDDGPDVYPEAGLRVLRDESPVAFGDTGLDVHKTLQSVLYGAISAVAFAFGEPPETPKGNPSGSMQRHRLGRFRSAFSELSTCLTGNVLASVIIVGFVTGFLVVILSSDPFLTGIVLQVGTS